MVYLRLVFDERVYILNGCSSPYSITEIDNGNANDSALPYPVAVRTLKTCGKGRCCKSNRKVVDTVEREDYDNKRILFFGRKSDKF